MDALRYQPSADVIAHPMGQETVLLHLETSRFFELNRTGTRLWQLLLPVEGLLAGASQHPAPDGLDQAGLLGDVDEAVGSHAA